MTNVRELPADSLRFACNENAFVFSTTAEVPPLEVMIGQERAVKAMEFGLFSNNPGYNIFVSGLVGTGKITYAKAAVSKVAAKAAVPNDWCYVNNFDKPGQPIAISLPAGKGDAFAGDMQELMDDLKTDISKVFVSDSYLEARKDLGAKFDLQRTAIIDAFNQKAQDLGVMPQWSTTGFAGIPIVDDKPLVPEDYQKLDKNTRDEIDKKLLAVHELATDVIHQVQEIGRTAREELKELDSKAGLFAAGHLIDELRDKYRDFPRVVEYLDDVEQDVVKNINDYKPSAGDEEQNPFLLFSKNMQETAKEKYKVNLLVDNRELKGAPVVVETNPTYYNLVGRVEYESRMGVMSTDYTMIKPGALHKANGGYLILNVRDVLANWGAWEALKRVLKDHKLLIENLGEQYGMLAMSSLKPQEIPVQVKIVLIGNPNLYHLLYTYDEDFRKLFKIHADFDVEMDNTAVNVDKLAGFVSSTVRRESLREFDRSAVARVVEHCVRLSGSQNKLTTRFNDVVEILCEADAWAAMEGISTVSGKHVLQAIREKRLRSNKYEEKLQEMFAEGKILIDVDGEKVGQVNGLAVLAVGDYTFGKPSRITANTYLGKSGIINIERETKMSGTTHSKGVLTLSGYIGEKYARDVPLTLSASLTFEQLYDGVDGDSASSTELYALLSSLSGLPIRQYIAVTGSVNQKGEVQPIGGVVEKIEGFFAVCKLKGLTGKQGVMIPQQNINNLVLNDEVIDAVREGKFHIWPVKSIDEGIEILTGAPAGEEQDGRYPAGTVHDLVSRKLRSYTDKLLELVKAAEDDKKL